MDQHLLRLSDRLRRVSSDYLAEVSGWTRTGAQSAKSLPYHDWNSFRAIQTASAALYDDCPTVRSVVGKMVSYCVSSGHTYGVSQRFVPGTLSSRKPSKRLLDEIEAIVEMTLDAAYPGGWQAMQEESMLRLMKEGEFFRRIFESDGLAVVRFIEPSNIRPPRLDSDGNRDLGLITDPLDAVTVVGYWLHTPPDKYKKVLATEIQHAKYGVDANDPRGVSPFWSAVCHSQRIKEVDVAMCELAITQASYAVIRQYETGVTIDNLRRIASSFESRKTDNAGRPVPGSEVDARGFQFQFPSADVNSAAFIEIIAQQQRFIGGLVDMPEFMVSADARTGNRASLITAEGPFDRRIQRDQRRLANHDVDLLWRSVQTMKRWSDDELMAWRRVIKIEPRFPKAASRDLPKEAASIINQVAAGLKSPQQGCSELGVDYDLMQSQLDRHNEDYPGRAVGGVNSSG